MPFTKGDKNIHRTGRPKKSKNLLPIIREKVLQAIDKRISGNKALRDVPMADLLRAAVSLMPKDLTVTAKRDITYISNTPDAVPMIEHDHGEGIQTSVPQPVDIIDVTPDAAPTEKGVSKECKKESLGEPDGSGDENGGL